MHNLDRKWTDLAQGYQAIQAYKTRLEAEFGRAVRVVQKQQLRQDLIAWQKKRRVFFALAALAPLSIITLCVTAFYYRDVACVIVYWALLVMVILVTLAVAGRQTILDMLNGKPVPRPDEGLAVDLEDRWWERLSPPERTTGKTGKNEPVDFPALLASSLPDAYLTRAYPDDRLILMGPTGIWIFTVVEWSGTIVKQEGVWKQVQPRSERAGRKNLEEPALTQAPDDLWLLWKQGIEKTIETDLPGRAWITSHLQGGVVFSHPKARPDRDRILGNTAPYGSAKGWVTRLQNTPALEGFTPDIQLEILDSIV